MISSNFIEVVSDWEVNGPFSIFSSITVENTDEGDRQCHSYTPPSQLVNLFPNATEDQHPQACSIHLRSIANFKLVSVEVCSNARHMEVYGDLKEYVSTVRGAKMENDLQSNIEENEGECKLYKKLIEFDDCCKSCNLKFLSLSPKKCFKLRGINIKLKQADPSSHVPGGNRQIDMAKVRSLLSSMPNEIPENVENLMTTVEQYQENQSSVLKDLQEQAIMTSTSSTNPITTKLPGMLSLLTKGGSFQQQTDSEPHVDLISKMMSQLGSGSSNVVCGQRGGTTQTEDLGSGDDMFSMLRNICQDVTQMRNMNRHDGDEKFEQEKGATEMSKDMPSVGKCSCQEKSTAEMENRLLQQMHGMEERMMGRLERHLEKMENKLELRLNHIETLLRTVSESNIVKTHSTVENSEVGNGVI